MAPLVPFAGDRGDFYESCELIVMKLFNRKRYYAAVIIVFTLLITSLQYSTIPRIQSLHDLYMEFYYVPIFLGALVFGLKGAVWTYFLVFVLYLPFIFLSWTGFFIAEANKFVHLLLQGLFAITAGYLIDRDKRRVEQLEREMYLAHIGKVATTIVHDLKNPLITVLGFARRLQEGKGDPGRDMQAIIDSAQDMQKIVYDVIDFAKPVRLEMKEEDIGNLIRRACGSCRTKAERWGVVILTELPSDTVSIPIDGFNFERAIVNIINNAIEASVREQAITVSAAAGRKYLTIKIRDNGSGMDRETIEHIFIPFYTKKQWGTGLGMSIAKKVIEGHQGSIRINSHPGRGTEVIIKLPLNPA
ncbi:MAG: sensor histidine kinase [Nitrospiraceae bacterium]|nr:MAG: sensor histidine kinase [Nitrospiraceae bacterium]